MPKRFRFICACNNASMIIQNMTRSQNIIHIREGIEKNSRDVPQSHTLQTTNAITYPLFESVGNVAVVIPFDLPSHILDLFKLVAELHHRETNHPWVKTERSPDGRLHWPRCVESHDEVVTICIPGLMFRGGPGQSKVAPIRVAADYAAGPEDLNTSVAGDSIMGLANSVSFYRNTESTHDRRAREEQRSRETYSRTSWRLPGRTCHGSVKI